MGLDANIVSILWVLLSVFLVIAAVVCVAGKLGDIVGQAALYNYGFAIFTIGSLIAGFSQASEHGHDLIAYVKVVCVDS